LRARLHRHRVPVTTIKLGFVDTAMTFGRPGTFLVASPESAAAAIVRHAEVGADVRYGPPFWRPLMLRVRLIPERIFKRLDVLGRGGGCGARHPLARHVSRGSWRALVSACLPPVVGAGASTRAASASPR